VEIYNESVLNSTATFDNEAVVDTWILDKLKLLKPPYGLWVVLNKKDEVVGWLSLAPFDIKPAYCITATESLYIAKNSHGQGIGRQLLTFLLNHIQNQTDLHHVIARITEGNHVSVALHEKMGFRKIGELEKVGLKFGRFLSVGYYQWTAERPRLTINPNEV
jgi:L-amino acid N-acyltransferase